MVLLDCILVIVMLILLVSEFVWDVFFLFLNDDWFEVLSELGLRKFSGLVVGGVIEVLLLWLVFIEIVLVVVVCLISRIVSGLLIVCVWVLVIRLV